MCSRTSRFVLVFFYAFVEVVGVSSIILIIFLTIQDIDIEEHGTTLLRDPCQFYLRAKRLIIKLSTLNIM